MCNFALQLRSPLHVKTLYCFKFFSYAIQFEVTHLELGFICEENNGFQVKVKKKIFKMKKKSGFGL